MRRWHGSTVCGFCGEKIADVLIDGKTKAGQWAVMCANCFKKHGVGFGLGKGQKYVADVYGRFVKDEAGADGMQLA